MDLKERTHEEYKASSASGLPNFVVIAVAADAARLKRERDNIGDFDHLVAKLAKTSKSDTKSDQSDANSDTFAEDEKRNETKDASNAQVQAPLSSTGNQVAHPLPVVKDEDSKPRALSDVPAELPESKYPGVQLFPAAATMHLSKKLENETLLLLNHQQSILRNNNTEASMSTTHQAAMAPLMCRIFNDRQLLASITSSTQDYNVGMLDLFGGIIDSQTMSSTTPLQPQASHISTMLRNALYHGNDSATLDLSAPWSEPVSLAKKIQREVNANLIYQALKKYQDYHNN